VEGFCVPVNNESLTTRSQNIRLIDNLHFVVTIFSEILLIVVRTTSSSSNRHSKCIFQSTTMLFGGARPCRKLWQGIVLLYSMFLITNYRNVLHLVQTTGSGGNNIVTSSSSHFVEANVWDPTLAKNRNMSDSRKNWLSWMWQPPEFISESDLEERWHVLEQRLQQQRQAVKMEDVQSDITNGLETLKDEVNETVHFLAQRLETNVQQTTQSLRQAFIWDVLNQRHGLERWFRTIRNYLLFLLGGVTNFSGGLTPATARGASVLQFSFHTRSVLNVMGSSTKQREKKTTSFLEDNDPLLHNGSTSKNLRQSMSKWSRIITHVTSSIAFKDTVAVLAAYYISQNNIPPNYQLLLETTIPLASIAHVVFRSIRKIVKILQLQDFRQQQEQQHRETLLHHPKWFRKKENNHRQGNTVRPYRRNVTKYIMVSLATAMAGMAMLSTVPGVTLSMVAASLTGSTLMLDSIFDEVVGNWFDMLRHMNRQDRITIFRHAIRGLSNRLHREFLYPAQAALDELEAWLFSCDEKNYCSSSNSNNDNKNKNSNFYLRQRIRQAVNQSMDIKLAWMVAGVGVLMQVVLLNRGALFSWVVRCRWGQACYRGGKEIRTKS
jgi:hypothetical protein